MRWAWQSDLSACSVLMLVAADFRIEQAALAKIEDTLSRVKDSLHFIRTRHGVGKAVLGLGVEGVVLVVGWY